MTFDELWILRITVVVLLGYGFAMSILWLKCRSDLSEVLSLLSEVKREIRKTLNLPEVKKPMNTTDTTMDDVSDSGD